MDLALSVVLLEENLAFPKLLEEHLKATECCSINVSMMVIFTRSQNMCRVTDKKNNVTELFLQLVNNVYKETAQADPSQFFNNYAPACVSMCQEV